MLLAAEKSMRCTFFARAGRLDIGNGPGRYSCRPASPILCEQYRPKIRYSRNRIATCLPLHRITSSVYAPAPCSGARGRGIATLVGGDQALIQSGVIDIHVEPQQTRRV